MPSSRSTAEVAHTRAPISVVHSLANFGFLHAGTLPDQALAKLRIVCAGSACDSIHMNAEQLFDNNTLSLLKQGCHSHRTALVKLPDGYMMIVPALNHRVLSIIKDSPMCLPFDCHPSEAPPITPDGARSVFYSVAIPPGQEDQMSGFHAVFHDGYTEGHEISRFSPADHAIAQLAAAIPLQGQRIIMQSDNLGTLIAQSLTGSDADLLKQTFLHLVETSGGSTGSDVYDAPIETSRMIADLLQLKNRKGQISLGRCLDGIYGYRRRPDGNNTFIFVASSDDFHADEPSPVDQSLLHVFKMSYKDTSDTGPRVFVRVGGGGGGGRGRPCSSSCITKDSTNNNFSSCGFNGDNNHHNQNHITINATLPPINMIQSSPNNPYNLPELVPGSQKTQDILNQLEQFMRSAARDRDGCRLYPEFCKQEALDRVDNNTPVNPLEAAASHVLLGPTPGPPREGDGGRDELQMMGRM
jgi:hypothetical protein